MRLTTQQKMRIITATICFIFFFGFLRLLVTNEKKSINDLLINSMLFFVWLGLSTAITKVIVHDIKM